MSVATIVGPGAGYFATSYEDQLNNYVFHGTPFSLLPGAMWLGLSTIPANKAGTISELAGNGYGRAHLLSTVMQPSPTEVGTYLFVWTNNAPVNFGTPTGPWSQAVCAFIADAQAGGHVTWAGNLLVPQAFTTGDPVSFAAGALVIAR